MDIIDQFMRGGFAINFSQSSSVAIKKLSDIIAERYPDFIVTKYEWNYPTLESLYAEYSYIEVCFFDINKRYFTGYHYAMQYNKIIYTADEILECVTPIKEINQNELFDLMGE